MPVMVDIFYGIVIFSTVLQRIDLYKIPWVSFLWETICCQEQAEEQSDGQRNMLMKCLSSLFC